MLFLSPKTLRKNGCLTLCSNFSFILHVIEIVIVVDTKELVVSEAKLRVREKERGREKRSFYPLNCQEWIVRMIDR
jgi:hypothetical protein